MKYKLNGGTITSCDKTKELNTKYQGSNNLESLNAMIKQLKVFAYNECNSFTGNPDSSKCKTAREKLANYDINFCNKYLATINSKPIITIPQNEIKSTMDLDDKIDLIREYLTKLSTQQIRQALLKNEYNVNKAVEMLQKGGNKKKKKTFKRKKNKT